MARPLLIAGVLFLAPLGALSAEPEKPENAIRRLSPGDFPEAPTKFRKVLEAERCMIPQTESPHGNLFSAELAAKGQTDWVTLCSRDGRSHRVVYWGGPKECRGWDAVAESDNAFLQRGADGKDFFSHRLSRYAPGDIGEASRSKLKRAPDHDALLDEFEGKTAIVMYCEDGTWKPIGAGD